jgi:hypothetical protein
MNKSPSCSYCSEPAVSHTTVRSGEGPKDPKKAGTQSDLRKVEVIRVCFNHRNLIPDPERKPL